MRSRGALGIGLALLLLVMPAAASAARITDTNRADEAVKDDLRSIATQMETFLTDQSRYPSGGDVNYNGKRTLKFLDAYEVRLAFGDRLRTIKLTDDGLSYCLKVDRAEGASSTTESWRVVSDSKRFMGTGPCPDRYVATSYPVPK
jgi:hypothetical protein